ncbi:MAG: hypothetical protein AABX54_04285 [Nanoarchaeota archaeon]
MTTVIRKRLIEEGKKGLLALAELLILQLEQSNQQLIAKYNQDDNAVPKIDRNLHNNVGNNYNSIVRMYGELVGDWKPFGKFTERYRKAREQRNILLIAYQDRRRDLAVAIAK